MTLHPPVWRQSEADRSCLTRETEMLQLEVMQCAQNSLFSKQLDGLLQA